jgi:hypothetical protein
MWILFLLLISFARSRTGLSQCVENYLKGLAPRKWGWGVILPVWGEVDYNHWWYQSPRSENHHLIDPSLEVSICASSSFEP